MTDRDQPIIENWAKFIIMILRFGFGVLFSNPST